MAGKEPRTAASLMSPNVDIHDGKGGVKAREKWSRQIDYLLSCIGFSVGLGNVWRFPYLCYKNGGGSFLIPYVTCALVGGVPLFFLEAALGQFMAIGGVGTWKICPLFEGIGHACAVINFYNCVYYIIILTWAFYYMFASFNVVLPWSTCDNPWNTARCTIFEARQNSSSTEANANRTTAIPTTIAMTMKAMEYRGASPHLTLDNVTNISLNTTRGVDPVTEYWERKVLGLSGGIGEVGTVSWQLMLCLLLAWVVCYFCVWKGIRSSGKVTYFTVTCPYVLMSILLVRGVLLDGAGLGITYYLKPDWSRLLDLQVWSDAGTQIFYSYSIAIGTHNALGSYNNFHHNSYRDCIIFACINSGTSLLAGFIIFSILGFMAHTQNLPVSQVAASGPGLAFIAYPKAVAQMPAAPVWSVMFFFMLILLGLDSQFVQLEGFITACVDAWPNQLRKGYRREVLIALICIVCFHLGITMITEGGMYVFQLMDYFSGSRIILLVAFFEVVAVGWIYGVRRFYDNLEMMYGFRINYFMWAMWLVGSPCFCMVLFIMNSVTYSKLSYDRKLEGLYVYPDSAVAMGWVLSLSSAMCIPIVMVCKVVKTRRSGKPLRTLIEPEGLKPHQLRPQDVKCANGVYGFHLEEKKPMC
ncbi:sodium- and chloride-dependent taurine transporter-like [Lineus longissimus]|uniref:sodium- and chloride-dependent taurine transporter-like n=1 Tax=Lineus longissimus TaxID=88925 RepID=UPI00315DA72E